MAKTRVTVTEDELKLVELTKELTKLQGKRRRDANALAELDQEIGALNRELHASLPPVAPIAPPA